MSTVQVRYIVNDVDAAIAFYTQHLGFHEDLHPAPIFAMLSRGDLRLVLSAPSGPNTGGGSALLDGRMPEPWWREPLRRASRRHHRDGFAAAPSRSSFPQRHHPGGWRPPGDHRGPVWQPSRAVRTRTTRSPPRRVLSDLAEAQLQAPKSPRTLTTGVPFHRARGSPYAGCRATFCLPWKPRVGVREGEPNDAEYAFVGEGVEAVVMGVLEPAPYEMYCLAEGVCWISKRLLRGVASAFACSRASLSRSSVAQRGGREVSRCHVR
jgi:catechol 2,3-dioxygenase-like lactoylglutathione lyase family enzyme